MAGGHGILLIGIRAQQFQQFQQFDFSIIVLYHRNLHAIFLHITTPVFKNQLSSVIFSRHLRFRQPKYTFGDKITEAGVIYVYDIEKQGGAHNEIKK
jgi:hypothetical protein